MHVVILLIFTCIVQVFSTYSIVAVDSVTGEVGSAGATCGDSVIWPGTPGAKIISDIIPGVGAIHTQSFYIEQNQTGARARMLAGDSPNQIIDWLDNNDHQSNSSNRQYGIVDYNNGTPRRAAFTGANCLDYKNHILGPNYAIQGNILSGQEILDSMESRFLNSHGKLADKLMAALQGANVAGADTRCLVQNTSALSAFIRVAKPDDNANNLYLDINVGATPRGVEPVDELQKKFDTWKSNLQVIKELSLRIKLVARKGGVKINLGELNANEIKIVSPKGQVIKSIKVVNTPIQFIPFKGKGIFYLNLYLQGKKIKSQPLLFIE